MTRRGRRITRGVVLFSAGLLGVGLETLYSLRYHESPDSTLILLFSAMMGLPVYISQDNKGRGDRDRSHRDDDDEKPGRHVDE